MSGYTPLGTLDRTHTVALEITRKHGVVATITPTESAIETFYPIMKTIFLADTTSKGGRSETNPAPNGLQNTTRGNFGGGRSFSTGLSWSAQSGRNPVRRGDDSAFMKSQLG